MSGFRLSVPILPRFRDTDAMGHVNNAVLLSYLEVGREAYWREVMGIPDYRNCGLILARVEIDFRRPAAPAETLEVSLRVCRIGTSSFDLAYEVRERSSGTLVAEARSVQVMYDYARGEKRPLTADERDRMKRFEGEIVP
jgi:acyl-CoA thioester hydrolase